MSVLGNIIWIIFGGFFSFLGYVTGGLSLCLTIIGIPFGIASFKLGWATLAPFGGTIVEKPDANNLLRLIFNALWIVSFGLAIAINHLFWALILAITVVGIPFAKQHLKLVPLALLPFGREFCR
jgi:uncharacterized membrane protein YccF (DUF307 family)